MRFQLRIYVKITSSLSGAALYKAFRYSAHNHKKRNHQDLESDTSRNERMDVTRVMFFVAVDAGVRRGKERGDWSVLWM